MSQQFVSLSGASRNEIPTVQQGVLHRVRRSVAAITNGSAEGLGSMITAGCSGNARDARGANAVARRTDERSEAIAFEMRLAPLTERQRQAIALLTMGKSIVATAKSLKVDPSTIHRWKASTPQFVAELNRRQAALYDNIVVKLRVTMEAAVDQLHDVLTGISKHDRIDAMWKLLPMLKPQRLIRPIEETSAIEILNAKVREARRQAGEVIEMEITDDERLAHVWPEDRAEGEVEEPAVAEPVAEQTPVAAEAAEAK